MFALLINIKIYCTQNINDTILKLKVMGARIRSLDNIPNAMIDYCFRRSGNTCIDKSMEKISKNLIMYTKNQQNALNSNDVFFLYFYLRVSAGSPDIFSVTN
jgi:hypothetical protein